MPQEAVAVSARPASEACPRQAAAECRDAASLPGLGRARCAPALRVRAVGRDAASSKAPAGCRGAPVPMAAVNRAGPRPAAVAWNRGVPAPQEPAALDVSRRAEAAASRDALARPGFVGLDGLQPVAGRHGVLARPGFAETDVWRRAAASRGAPARPGPAALGGWRQAAAPRGVLARQEAAARCDPCQAAVAAHGVAAGRRARRQDADGRVAPVRRPSSPVAPAPAGCRPAQGEEPESQTRMPESVCSPAAVVWCWSC